MALAAQTDVPEQPLAWMVRVARNSLRRQHRSDVRRRKRERTAAQVWFTDRSSGDPDQAIDAAAAATLALRAIPSPAREIIVMHLWGEMTFGEIASVTEYSKAAVHRHYHDGLRQLHRRLDFDQLPTPSVS